MLRHVSRSCTARDTKHTRRLLVKFCRLSRVVAWSGTMLCLRALVGSGLAWLTVTALPRIFGIITYSIRVSCVGGARREEKKSERTMAKSML